MTSLDRRVLRGAGWVATAVAGGIGLVVGWLAISTLGAVPIEHTLIFGVAAIVTGATAIWTFRRVLRSAAHEGPIGRQLAALPPASIVRRGRSEATSWLSRIGFGTFVIGAIWSAFAFGSGTTDLDAALPFVVTSGIAGLLFGAGGRASGVRGAAALAVGLPLVVLVSLAVMAVGSGYPDAIGELASAVGFVLVLAAPPLFVGQLAGEWVRSRVDARRVRGIPAAWVSVSAGLAAGVRDHAAALVWEYPLDTEGEAQLVRDREAMLRAGYEVAQEERRQPRNPGIVVNLAVWAVGAGSASDPGWIRVLYRHR